ncbi:MAG: type 2 lantipeptide synthetase LanM [Ectothiorhodospiraceae bacterium]|nr:type 2 lantipeptide synthetase LanM [Ectothiorhodospiraceae bacterium]
MSTAPSGPSSDAVAARDDAWLAALVARALAPSECVASSASTAPGPEARRLAERWRTLLERRHGGPAAAERRLSELGVDLVGLARRLERDRPTPEARSAPWVRMLDAAFGAVSCTAETASAPREWRQRVCREASAPDTTAPRFPALVEPFVDWVLAEVTTRAPRAGELVTHAVWTRIAADLVARLSALAARTVVHEMKRWCAAHPAAGASGAERYRAHVDHRLAEPGARAELLARYPVLARQMAETAVQATDAVTELLERLDGDRSAIARVLGDGCAPGRACELAGGLSDPHDGGRTVWRVTFESGLRVVYKPRSLEVDVAYLALVAWIAARGGPRLRAARVLAGDGYGWAEHVDLGECRDDAAVARYFERQGAHAALFHVLCASDMHWDNFIPAGEHPVPIDLECVLVPTQHVAPASTRDLPRYLQPMQGSVVSTAMASIWKRGDYDQPLFTASGIAGVGDRAWPIREGRWEALGTDRMRLRFDLVTHRGDGCLPRLDGRPVGAEAHRGAVLAGFATMASFLAAHRTALDAADGPLAAFARVPARLVVRDTKEYADLLFWGSAPDQLTSGAAYDVALDLLYGAVPTLALDGRPSPAVVAAEKRALWRGDIPRFGVPADRNALVLEDGTEVGPLAAASAFEQMRERLSRLDDAEIAWQGEILRCALAMSAEPPVEIDLAPGREHTARHAAAGIGAALRRLAARTPDGATWPGLYHLGTGSRMVQLFLPYPWSTLGAAGTAVFLGRLARAEGDAAAAELAREAMRFAVAVSRASQSSREGPRLVAGGFNGLGLVLYALSDLARSLADPSLADAALEVALSNALPRWTLVDNPDVLTGAGGTLLALAHLHRARPDPRLVERAVALGEGIERHAVAVDGHRAWLRPGCSRPLLGMGHGAAGIALALSRLSVMTGDERWLESARRGLAFEHAGYLPDPGDWPDRQHDGPGSHFMTGWCSGAAGIGLARLATLPILDEPMVRLDIERAIDAARRHVGADLHNLCCGESGRIAFLLRAAHDLDRPALAVTAGEAVDAMLAHARATGCWRLQHFSERNIVPGLGDGIAGVGLALLGAAGCTDAASVLTFE